MSHKEMSVLAHIADLRRTLVVSAIALTLCSLIVYGFFSEAAMELFIAPLERLHIPLRFIGVGEGFLAYVKVSFFLGFVVSSPIILWEILRFILPALYKNEKRIFLILVFSTVLLFVLGVVFAYCVVLPLALKALLFDFSGRAEPFITANNYLSFLSHFLLPFGLIFEIPLITSFLTFLGILTPERLAKPRRYMFVLIFIVAAILTPPDVVSQMCMAVPMLALYEGSILLAKPIALRRSRRLTNEEEMSECNT